MKKSPALPATLDRHKSAKKTPEGTHRSLLRKLAKSRRREITSSKQTLKKVEVIELVRQQRAENRQELIYSARPFVLCGMLLKL